MTIKDKEKSKYAPEQIRHVFRLGDFDQEHEAHVEFLVEQVAV